MPDQQEAAAPDPDAGEDLKRLLTDVEDPVSAEFLQRVRRSIHRRTTVAQFSAFSWRMPGSVLTELVKVLGFLPRSLSKEEQRWK